MKTILSSIISNIKFAASNIWYLLTIMFSKQVVTIGTPETTSVEFFKRVARHSDRKDAQFFLVTTVCYANYKSGTNKARESFIVAFTTRKDGTEEMKTVCYSAGAESKPVLDKTYIMLENALDAIAKNTAVSAYIPLNALCRKQEDFVRMMNITKETSSESLILSLMLDSML